MLPNPGGSTGHASNFIFLTDRYSINSSSVVRLGTLTGYR